VLKVPIPFFFEGAPASSSRKLRGNGDAAYPSYISSFLATSDGISLAKAFMKIDRRLRLPIVHLVENLAGG
jgi:hypothetical protein